MTDFRHFAKLHNAQDGHVVLQRMWGILKPWLLAGHVLEVRVGPETRTGEQNAKFHAMAGDFAKAGMQWAGKPRNLKQWKVLLVSGHAVATGEGSDMVPGLEGEFVNLRESTAAMSKRRGASLIDYTQAMGDQMGVVWSEKARGP